MGHFGEVTRHFLFGRILFESVIGKGDDHTEDHQADPYENEVAPTESGGGIGENQICGSSCYVAEKIDVARDRRDHARIPKGGKVTAEKHGCRSVGRHDGKDHADDIEDRLRDQVGQDEEYGRRGEHQQDGFIHIVPQSLINKDGNKGGQGDDQGGDGENGCRIFRRKVKMLRQIGGHPKHHRGTHNTRENRDQRKFDDPMLEKDTEISASFLLRRILIVLNDSFSFQPCEAEEAHNSHDEEGNAADRKHTLPDKQRSEKSCGGGAEKGSKGITETAPCRMDRIGILRDHFGHRTVDHGQAKACYRISDHSGGWEHDDVGKDQIGNARSKQTKADHPFGFDLIANGAVDQLSHGIKDKIQRGNTADIGFGIAVLDHLRRDGTQNVSCDIYGKIRNRAKGANQNGIFCL